MAEVGGRLRLHMRDFVIPALEDTGVSLGRGAYGEVVEMRLKGEKVAVKKIHQIFLGAEGWETALAQFESECVRLSSITHPNIVKFLGIYFEQNSDVPMLVMEYVPVCLKNYVERNSVPDHTKTQIMLDIAEGLKYMHELSPPLIHRDLTSNNVLLTDTLQAKITDLGTSKLLSHQAIQVLTNVPGNESHMPPEAKRPDEQKYTQTTVTAVKLDVFSFGNVLINVLIGEYPIATSDRDVTNRRKNEVQRRQHLLAKIPESKEKDLIIRCLNMNPAYRPTADELVCFFKGEKLEDDQAVDEDEIIFVDPPSYDVKCPICFELFDEPHQSLCCGNHVCKECFNKQKNNNCPLCRDPDFSAVPDKFFARQLRSIHVECHNGKKGCPWSGELRMLKQHVEEACEKNMITCKHCLLEIARNLFNEHVHTCQEIPQPCPSKCTAGNIKRKLLKQHLECECPLRVVRGDPIPRTANNCIQQIPLTVTMAKYSQYAESGDKWYSQPFYTHKNGYKIHLQACINRYMANHVTVLVGVLKGERDDKLRWPVRANIEVALYNWRTKTPIFSKVLYLVGDAFCAQNTSNFPASWGKGRMDYVNCESLALNLAEYTSYLEHDCLNFCIKKVTFLKEPTIPVLPKWADSNTFVVPSFTPLKKKEKKTTFYGPPVYTGKNGYKLCPRVNAYGYGAAEKTHVSICCTLMKGEHDDKLLWPIEADITIEMLNWREDKNHKACTISFGQTCEVGIISRVFIGGIAVRCMTFNLAAFSALTYNQQINTEYLRQDCLLFKVKPVTAYFDRESYSKLPSWVDPVKGSLYPCFTLPEFEKRMKHNNSAFSHPFYSHHNGYKMQFKINASNGQNVGLFVYLMRGPNDDQLQWPFCGDFVLQLVNWQSDKNHHSKVLKLNENCTNTVCQRVVGSERGMHCWGYSNFISHEALKNSTGVEYLHNNCLNIRVKEIVVHSKPPALYAPAWQGNKPSPFFQFTMSNFTKRKELDSNYYSPAFFSHSGGYKMCIEIDPNNKNHISVYVKLLKGENDAKLSWPFYGSIVIDLLNHISDSKHLEYNIKLHERIEKSYNGRVGDSPNETWGFPQATSHSALAQNKSSSTDFVRNDCLCFRIKNVVSYSHNLRVPRWQNSSTPACFTVTSVSERVQTKSIYYSPPFFVAKYKMCLKLNFDVFNESETAKYVSVFACLLKGDQDDSLQWPFCGDLTIEIQNWYDDHGHFKGVVHLNFPDDPSHARVCTEEVQPSGFGKFFFIPISTLFSQFLYENCMRIRVSRVDCYSTPLSLKCTSLQARLQSKYLFEFTINSISTRIRNQSMIKSSAFYTHQNGYKMRLEVYPEGSEGNRGNVSVYARLLAGEHDSSLKWPMNVALKVELLNWLSNSYHVMENIRFGRASSHACDRVSPDDVSARELFGYGKFCSHGKLFGKEHKIEYVQEDCIRVRVTNALIFSHNKGFFN